jgi:hypothetical protein
MIPGYYPFVDYGLTFIVIVLGIFAFLQAEGNMKLVIVLILVALFLLPALGHAPAVRWISWGGKIVFGLWCYIYLKSKGFWSFGR